MITKFKFKQFGTWNSYISSNSPWPALELFLHQSTRSLKLNEINPALAKGVAQHTMVRSLSSAEITCIMIVESLDCTVQLV